MSEGNLRFRLRIGHDPWCDQGVRIGDETGRESRVNRESLGNTQGNYHDRYLDAARLFRIEITSFNTAETVSFPAPYPTMVNSLARSVSK